MSANVSFTGLNSNIDSGSLISQLVAIELQNKILPLESKISSFRAEDAFLGGIRSTVDAIQSLIDFDNVKDGGAALMAPNVSSSDTENEFINISSTESAVPQTFDLNILKLASNTVRKSSQSMSLGISGSSQLTDVNLKSASNISSGTVTIGGETRTFTEAARTVLKSATAITQPADVTESSVLDDANFQDGVTLTAGDITINGETRNYSPDTSTDTIQDMLDFLAGFSGITAATLDNGQVKLEGITSLDPDTTTSNIFDALGMSADDISDNTLTASKDLRVHTLSDFSVDGTELTINGETITFDPNVDTMNDLISRINSNSNLDLTASYDSDNDHFVLTNNVASTDSITVSSSDSNIITTFDLTDHTPGDDNSVDNILSFLEGFSSVTSAQLVDGHVELTGSFSNIGGAGDSSNMVSALGLDNAPINAGTLTGIQNLDAPESSTLLSDIGVTSTTITINGSDVAIDSNDTVQDFVNNINNQADTRVSAFYDTLNGEIVLTNDDTGSLSLTVSGDGDFSALNLTGTGAETLGDNAEFTISTLNGGSTLVSNENKVDGLIEGLTIDLNKVTTDPIKVTVEKDAGGYTSKIEGILNDLNGFISVLSNRNDSFSRNFVGRIRTLMASIPGDPDNDTVSSFLGAGLESNVDSEGNFLGYKLDTERFQEVLDASPSALNSLLWGNDDFDSIYPQLSNGNDGVLTQLHKLLDSYSDPVNGVIKEVRNSISNQIDTTQDRIERQQSSIDALEARLIKQFAQLDVITAQFQQQQAAIANLGVAQ